MLGIKKVAIYTKKYNSKCVDYEKIKGYGFELIEYQSKEEFINIDINLKVIAKDINHDETVNAIKEIRSKYTKSQTIIILCLEENNIKNISQYMKLGINDYIKMPYSTDEIYFRLMTNLESLDEDSKFQITIDNLPFQIWVTDLEGTYLKANQKFANHFTTTVDNMIGKSAKDFYDDDEVRIINNQNKKLLEKKETVKFNAKYTDNKNKLRTIEVYKKPIFDSYNKITGITGTIIDVTDLKDAQQESKNQALTDLLTSLPNRRALYEYIEKNEDEISVMLIDVDNFKFINDTYGHNIGDHILKKVSNRLKEVFKDSFVCRLGGDEFLVILKNVDEREYIYDKARDLINKEKLDCDKYDVSLSVGMVFNETDKDISRILARADLAMYKAKENGKNSYLEYTDEMGKEKLKKIEIENCIKKYKERDDFKLYYQPQYTSDEKIIGVEALLRWENEKYKNIPISDIIQIMEESDLIIDIGYFIIKKAFEFAHYINKNRKDKIVVSVNISAIQIMEKNFVENIQNILLETKVNPNLICIEITETSLLKDMKKNAQKVNMLKDIGMNISIDDFGTGYSSISYILELPINSIKIDKSLIDLVHDEQKHRNMINLIVNFSKLSDLKVVAEGVEYRAQLETLKNMNVDYFQGYLLNRPLKEEDVIRVINEDKE